VFDIVDQLDAGVREAGESAGAAVDQAVKESAGKAVEGVGKTVGSSP
jgi:hypothetical protein